MQPARILPLAAIILASTLLPCTARAQTQAPPPQPVPLARNIQVFHYYGQTFIYWEEDPVAGEFYRFYRSANVINDVGAPGVERLEIGGLPVEVWENSGEFYSDRVLETGVCSHSTGGFQPRFVQRLCAPTVSSVAPCGTTFAPTTSVRPMKQVPQEGLLVWTLHASDTLATHYAITVVSGGQEHKTCVQGQNTNSQAITELVCDPMPLDVSAFVSNPLIPSGLPAGYRLYLQYMDLREWNSTFHAPNATNCWWGENPALDEIRNARQYAYTYLVREPDPSWSLPGSGFSPPWPVLVDLHQRMANRINVTNLLAVPNPGPAMQIIPIDVSDTWWFGFSKDHEYRKPYVTSCGVLIPDCNSNRPNPFLAGMSPENGSVVNYTQQRVLRMIYDLTRDHNYLGLIDDGRVYAEGHSMGGSGALSFALHFPNVFAATASSKPVTDYLGYLSLTGSTCGPKPVTDYSAEMYVRWGNKALGFDLPVILTAPNHWADHLSSSYGNTPVWQWLDHKTQMGSASRKLDEMAPFGIVNGKRDPAIPIGSQGTCAYPVFGEAKRAWGGVINCSAHTSEISVGVPPNLSYRYDTTSGSSVLATWPFSDYSVKLREVVPGFSNYDIYFLSPPSTMDGLPCQVPPFSCGPTPEQGDYHHNLLWSSSWDRWDVGNGNVGSPGVPIDRSNLLVLSLKFLGCGTADHATVDVTPRRWQSFDTGNPLANYTWQNQDILTGQFTPVTPQPISLGTDGLLTIPGFLVTTNGNRLFLRK